MAKRKHPYRRNKILAQREEKRRRMEPKFPNCIGLYPECPDNIDLENIDDECKMCLKYREWRSKNVK